MTHFKRSEKVSCNPLIVSALLGLVHEGIEISNYYQHINNYPYDLMKQEGSIYKEVRTLHITFWYEKGLDITEIIDQYVSDGYHPQINTKEQKSIPEIDHIHFIKVLEYL